MKRIVACFSLALTLAACASAPRLDPKVVTKEVDVPVAVPCVVTVAVPAFVDTDAALKAAPTWVERLKLIVAGRLQHIAYEAQLVAAQGGCSK